MKSRKTFETGRLSSDTYPQSDPHEIAMFSAELGETPFVDLHGMEPHEAIPTLDAFINHECMRGSEAVRIIHGRGTGILRNAVHLHLKNHALITAFRDATDPAQVGGVTIAALEKIKAKSS